MTRYRYKIKEFSRFIVPFAGVSIIFYVTYNIFMLTKATDDPELFVSFLNVVITVFQAIIVVITLLATIFLSFEKARGRLEFYDFFSLKHKPIWWEALLEIIKKPTKKRPPIIVPIFLPLCDEIHRDSEGMSHYYRESRLMKPSLTYSHFSNVKLRDKFCDGIMKLEVLEKKRDRIVSFFREQICDLDGLNKSVLKFKKDKDFLRSVEMERLVEKNFISFAESVLQAKDEVPMYSPVIVEDDFRCFRFLDRLFIEESGSALWFKTIKDEGERKIDELVDTQDTILMVGGNRSNVAADYILDQKISKYNRLFYVEHGSGNVDDDWFLKINLYDKSKDDQLVTVRCGSLLGIGVFGRIAVSKKTKNQSEQTSVFMIFGNTGENTRKMGEHFNMFFHETRELMRRYEVKFNDNYVIVFGIDEGGKINGGNPLAFMLATEKKREIIDQEFFDLATKGGCGFA